MSRHALLSHEEFKADIEFDFAAGIAALDDLEAKIRTKLDSIDALTLIRQ